MHSIGHPLYQKSRRNIFLLKLLTSHLEYARLHKLLMIGILSLCQSSVYRKR